MAQEARRPAGAPPLAVPGRFGLSRRNHARPGHPPSTTPSPPVPGIYASFSFLEPAKRGFWSLPSSCVTAVVSLLTARPSNRTLGNGAVAGGGVPSQLGAPLPRPAPRSWDKLPGPGSGSHPSPPPVFCLGHRARWGALGAGPARWGRTQATGQLTQGGAGEASRRSRAGEPRSTATTAPPVVARNPQTAGRGWNAGGERARRAGPSPDRTRVLRELSQTDSE